MKLKRVYRVENESGSGPFRPSHQWESEYPNDGRANAMPTPTNDERLMSALRKSDLYSVYDCAYMGIEARFAFRTLKELRQWFPVADRATRHLATCGYGVAVYECEQQNLFVGSTQVLFDIKHSTRVSFRPFREDR